MTREQELEKEDLKESNFVGKLHDYFDEENIEKALILFWKGIQEGKRIRDEEIENIILPLDFQKFIIEKAEDGTYIIFDNLGFMKFIKQKIKGR